MIRFAIVLLFATNAAALAAPSTAIIVNFGAHATAQAAANSETEVNWLDAGTRDDTACTDSFAALELQRCLRRMTGSPQDFAVLNDDTTPKGNLILVGGPGSNKLSRQWLDKLGVTEAELGALGRDGYRLKSTTVAGRQVILIAGGSRVGTLYGAYDLLYRLGCRWFAPGDSHEQLPRISKLGDWDVKEQPSFRNRGYYLWEDRGTPEFFLWMARNRMNYWWVGQTGQPLLHKLGIRLLAGFHADEIAFLNPIGRYPYHHPRFQGNDYMPADPYPVSPQYAGDADHDGKLSYFEAHPEWFAFDGQKRFPGMKLPFYGNNFCTSNPDALTEFMKNYITALGTGMYKGAEMARFMTLDGGGWCECEACKALGTPTDRNLLLVDRLNREIARARQAGRIPQAIEVSFIGYSDSLETPTRPLPKDFDRSTVATLYPIQRCYAHYFDDPVCAINARYLQQFRAWAPQPGSFFQGRLSVGEYYNISKCKCLPVCYMHSMAHDIPLYYRLGARDFEYMHVTMANWGPRALTNYQLARQLWNVDTDCPALWNDYFQQRYGSVAVTMRVFYESLEQMLRNVTELKYGLAPRLDRGAADLFPNSHLRYRREPGVTCDAPTLLEMVDRSHECRRLLTRAQQEAKDPAVKALLAEDDLAFTYAEQTLAYYHACVQAFQLARAGQVNEAKTAYQEARRLADLLRQDTHSAAFASMDANDVNALYASRARRAVAQIAKLLDQAPAAGAKSSE